MPTDPTPSECPDCGLNCDPECGTHPEGCLFAAVHYQEWWVAPRCTLRHENVERAKALRYLANQVYVRYAPY